jgi:two-component system, chemotaxis family, protein-glutamate methylesterase/glutaminase
VPRPTINTFLKTFLINIYMPKIRILIVDDAVVVRSRLKKILSADPELEVVGVAATGRIALAKLSQVNPDIVILDVDMPDLNGLETLTELRKTHPQLPVIMFSVLTYTGATATLDALTLGASDYATKPSNVGSMEIADRHIQETLIPKIKALNKSKVAKDIRVSACSQKSKVGSNQSSPASSASSASSAFFSPTPSTKPIKLVAIGVSTGGPNALASLLSELPADFPVPIAIVQHMPPVFTKLLAERLNTKCALQVEEARAGVRLNPGSVWLAPGDYHLTVKRDVNGLFLETNQNPPENSCRPSVDVLLRSIASICRDNFSTIAVILTGMGQDGLQGCREISHVGGKIIAQDEASSVVWGMPSFVVNAGLAERVLPLDAIAEELISRVNRSFNSTKFNPNHEPTSV